MLGINAITMLTPLGNAEQTVAGINAGMNVYQASAFTNRNNDPMSLCEIPAGAIPPVEDELKALSLTVRRERIIRIARAPLAELIEKAGLTKPTPLMLCVPEKIPGHRTPIDDRYFDVLLKPFGDVIDQKNSFVFPYGRAAIAYALDAAKNLLESGEFTHVIVGGVDTYRDQSYLEDLDLDGRILSAGNTDGFAPSEAAAYLLVSLSDNKSPSVITGWGATEEPGHRYSEEPYIGEALSDAASRALSTMPDNSISSLYANLNGESFFSKEWGVAQIRNQKYFAKSAKVLHPVDCFGDVGAAYGAVLLGLAAGQLTTGTHKGPALICASSELAPRAAIVLKQAMSENA